jgi:hypothetical protein
MIVMFLARRLSTWLLGAAGLMLAGCANIAMPELAPQGSVNDQVYYAHRYYPFPEPEVGPRIPEAMPREFSRPPAEPTRARYVRPPR